jgi:four helix bundle protein
MAPNYETGQDIRDRTFALACGIVHLGRELYDRGGVGRLLTPQLIGCSSSVSAMLEEARAAESKRDFISKCSIALKECRECHVRLRVLEQCHIGTTSEVTTLRQEAGELVAIISAIVRNARRNAGVAPLVRASIPNS